MNKAELIPDALKQKVRQIFKPFAGIFLKLGISPNAMTGLGVFLSMAAAIFFATKHLWQGGLFYLLAGLCDIFDGAMARIQGRGTSYGAFLDSTLDRMAEAIALMGVMVYFHRIDETPMIYITYLAVTASLLVSYTKARAEGLGQECDVGWLERPERVTLVVVGCLPALFVADQISWIWPDKGAGQNSDGLRVAMVVMMVFAMITIAQRMHHTWKGFKAQGKA